MRSIIEKKLHDLGLVSDEALAKLSVEEVRLICAHPSYDHVSFRKRMRIRNKTMQLLSAHLMLEHVSREFLNQEFQHKDIIKIDRWGLSQKLDLLHALGLIDPVVYRACLKINTLRNKAAHDYQFKVGQKEARDLLTVFPVEFFKEVGHPASFHNMLVVSVGLLEGFRVDAEVSSLKRRSAMSNVKVVLQELEADKD